MKTQPADGAVSTGRISEYTRKAIDGGMPTFLIRMLVTISLSQSSLRGQLIRPNHVYQSLISGVHDYFNSTCILLLHATVAPMSSEGTKTAVLLRNLQLYFSRKRHTRTAIMDLETFSAEIGPNYFRIKRPLFVILNDQGNIRQLLTSVSTWMTMSYPTWMIFFGEGTRADDFFARINIPFDCEFLMSESDGTMEAITEVYRVSPGDELRSTPFATWSPTHGMMTTSLTFYQRRNNLFGKTLRVTSMENPPASTILRDEDGEMIGVGGMFGRILEILKEEMNCTYQYIDGKAWGSLSPNGSWNGIIALLDEKRADLAASELVITTARIEVVDFTIPIISSRFHTYIQRPSFTFVKWRNYTAPFTASIWMAIGSLIILSGVMIFLTGNAGPYRYRRRNPNNPPLMEAIFFVFGAFCGQGMSPSTLSTTRAVHLAVHLTSVILLAAYSGALVSILAVQIFTMPFTTMEGMLRDGTYRFGVLPNSAEYNLFSNTTDQVLRALFQERMEPVEKLPRNYLEGLQRVCQEPGYGFMTTDTMVQAHENNVDCILESLETMLQTSLAMAVSRNSPYRGIVNSNILMMRDSGIFNRIVKSEWPIQFTKVNTEWTSVEFGDVVPLVTLILCGIILGSILACGERIIMSRSMQPRLGQRLPHRR